MHRQLVVTGPFYAWTNDTQLMESKFPYCGDYRDEITDATTRSRQVHLLIKGRRKEERLQLDTKERRSDARDYRV